MSKKRKKSCGTCILRKDCKIDNIYSCYDYKPDEEEIAEREAENGS